MTVCFVFLLDLVVDGKAINITFVSWDEVSKLVQQSDLHIIVDTTFANHMFEFIDVFFHGAKFRINLLWNVLVRIACGFGREHS